MPSDLVVTTVNVPHFDEYKHHDASDRLPLFRLIFLVWDQDILGDQTFLFHDRDQLEGRNSKHDVSHTRNQQNATVRFKVFPDLFHTFFGL